MNAKRAKALRRIERQLETSNLAYQEMLRQQIPVPVTTMSMGDFNKARVAVIGTTPRIPDGDLPDEVALAVDDSAVTVEIIRADQINQELRLGLLQQNAKHYVDYDVKALSIDHTTKHYIGSEMANVEFVEPVVKYFDARVTKTDVTEELIESRRAAKSLLPAPSTEELDRLQQSVNGPEAYAKMSSMGSADKVLHNGKTYKLTDMHGDMGVICPVKPESFIPEFKLSSMCGDGGVACRVMPASKDAQ